MPTGGSLRVAALLVLTGGVDMGAPPRLLASAQVVAASPPAAAQNETVGPACADNDAIFTPDFQWLAQMFGVSASNCAELVQAPELCKDLPAGCPDDEEGALCMLPLDRLRARFAQEGYNWNPSSGSGEVLISLYEICPLTCAGYGYALAQCFGAGNMPPSPPGRAVENRCSNMPGSCLECASFALTRLDCLATTPLDRSGDCLMGSEYCPPCKPFFHCFADTPSPPASPIASPPLSTSSIQSLSDTSLSPTLIALIAVGVAICACCASIALVGVLHRYSVHMRQLHHEMKTLRESHNAVRARWLRACASRPTTSAEAKEIERELAEEKPLVV
ncbi:hypothetical protein AB1Y20_000626 [Prymnesium parvum]|uniref:Uncharacterized protein n=1 Tax=Prymnesium parvum TaxID=97485 RepID=A0AB34K8J8_PRYPA